MHELSIMTYMLETVEAQAREAGARKVLTINLRAGERSGLVDDSLLFYFEMLTPDTVLEGAKVNVRRTPMLFHCAGCGRDYSPAIADFSCQSCGAVGRLVNDGTELVIESIEIDT